MLSIANFVQTLTSMEMPPAPVLTKKKKSLRPFWSVVLHFKPAAVQSPAYTGLAGHLTCGLL